MSQTTTREKKLPTLRVLVTSIVVLPIAAAAIALLTIAIVTSGAVSEQLGEELVADATARVTSEVRNYIRQAVQLSDVYARRLQTGKLSPIDVKSWEQMMFDDLATSPDVASICFGNPKGDAIYLQRAHGRVEFGVSDGSRDCAAIEWQAHLDGTIDRAKPLREYRYDPRARPWYVTAVKAGAPGWTPVYFWFGEAGGAMETGSGYTRPIEIDGKLAGVLTIDVTLGAVSDFLRRQPFATHGAIFVVDDAGMLVAASQGAVTSPAGKRLLLSQSDDETAQAVAAAEPQATTSIAAPTTAPQTRSIRKVNVKKLGLSRANIAVFHPYPGAHWRVITVLPESAFLSQAQAMRRRALVLASVAILGAMVVGLVFSRRLSRPLMKLIEHVHRIGSGDFDARLELEGAQELQKLARETNRMAAGLRERMELEKSVELATHVQQSLLPDAAPMVHGLQLYGHSRYCDATGGDYLDFVDVAQLAGERVFIAVGDVTGHGLGAALLMAAARAAVRTSAAVGGETLGHVMTRVNDVLTRDARHGMFMTMLLMVVDPANGSVNWTSAGHDPAIVYDPADDSFRELEGGDLLLGVQESIRYGNFSWNGLHEGCVMFVGTDGVWEAFNEAGEMFGKDRLRDVIHANATLSPQEISVALEAAIEKFVGQTKIKDDITYVILKMERIEHAQVDL